MSDVRESAAGRVHWSAVSGQRSAVSSGMAAGQLDSLKA